MVMYQQSYRIIYDNQSNMNQNSNSRNQNVQSQGYQRQQGGQQSTSQWSQMIGQVLESVTGKNMSTTKTGDSG